MSLSVHIRKKLHSGTLNVNFESEDGIPALLGESGSGRTVLLRCIAGLETPDEGSIVVDGRTLYDSLQGINVPAGRRGIGLLDGNNLHPKRTVEENLRAVLKGRMKRFRLFGGRYRTIWDEDGRTRSKVRRSRPGARQRALLVDEQVPRLLREYGLDGLGGLYPKELTGEQRLMASFACVMAAGPRLVLLDNPFAQLEPFPRARTLRSIRERLNGVPDGPGAASGAAGSASAAGTGARQGAGEDLLSGRAPVQAVFASADRDEVYAMGSHILVLERGASQPMKERDAFFSAPVTTAGALLSGCRNVTDAVRLDERHAFAPAWGAVFLPARQQVTEPAACAAGGGAERAAGARAFGMHGSIPPAAPGGSSARLPSGLRCVGIRETDFLRALPPKARAADYFRFTVHIQRIEETLNEWQVYFRTGNRMTQDLLWQVPKSEISRQELEAVRRLYVPEEKIMLLI